MRFRACCLAVETSLYSKIDLFPPLIALFLTKEWSFTLPDELSLMVWIVRWPSCILLISRICDCFLSLSTVGYVLNFPIFLFNLNGGRLGIKWDSFSIAVSYFSFTIPWNTAYRMCNPWTMTLNTFANYSLLMKLWLKLNFLIDLKMVSFWLISNFMWASLII